MLNFVLQLKQFGIFALGAFAGLTLAYAAASVSYPARRAKEVDGLLWLSMK